ncbi:MAG: sulfite exporter TauE/SafE family protein [Paracoccaceae bacterium]
MDGIDLASLVPIIGALIVAGGLIGLLAGVFGIGGGAISVPIFFELFRVLDYPEEVRMPMAVGTSLAVIIPTSLNSARGHFLRGTVDMDLLKLWAVPVILGVLAGSFVARYAEPVVFQIVFIAVALVNAAKLLTGGKGWRLAEGLPGRGVLRVYGGVLGVLSALMGIGGGAITNLILTLHGYDIRRAISTAAGVGVLIALPGTIGYMLAGWGKPGLPASAVGYVSLLTFALTIPTTLLTTRLGVSLAHSLPKRVLETGFGIFLLTVCARFVWDILA